MISKTNNYLFPNSQGMQSEQELEKADPKSAVITDYGYSAITSNPPQKDLYKDHWSIQNEPNGFSSMIDVLVSQVTSKEKSDKSATNLKEPASIEFPNIVFEKK